MQFAEIAILFFLIGCAVASLAWWFGDEIIKEHDRQLAKKWRDQ